MTETATTEAPEAVTPENRPWTVKAKGLSTYELANTARTGLIESGQEAKVRRRRHNNTFDVIARDKVAATPKKAKKAKRAKAE